jgi:hypothetical protein
MLDEKRIGESYDTLVVTAGTAKAIAEAQGKVSSITCAVQEYERTMASLKLLGWILQIDPMKVDLAVVGACKVAAKNIQQG